MAMTGKHGGHTEHLFVLNCYFGGRLLTGAHRSDRKRDEGDAASRGRKSSRMVCESNGPNVELQCFNDEDALHALRASYDFGCLPSLTSQHHTGPMMPHPIRAPSHHTMSHQPRPTMGQHPDNLYNAGAQTPGHATVDVTRGSRNFYPSQQQMAPPIQSKKQK
ncbi:hypothetical protein BGZ58_006780 [Dissophora ornata]|nr:hypothetical protein BGZ58_006780 [Dissophora ornata]